mgnify:CR=1 FL=1
MCSSFCQLIVMIFSGALPFPFIAKAHEEMWGSNSIFRSHEDPRVTAMLLTMPSLCSLLLGVFSYLCDKEFEGVEDGMKFGLTLWLCTR